MLPELGAGFVSDATYPSRLLLLVFFLNNLEEYKYYDLVVKWHWKMISVNMKALMQQMMLRTRINFKKLSFTFN